MVPCAAMVKTDNPGWAEGLQLVPIVTLAFPFIVRGEVDLSRAAGAFLIAAALTIPVTLAVLVRDHLLNPILVGTALWLWLGAVAFNVPADAAATWLTETQALGIFLFSLGVGSVVTFASPYGYIACRSGSPAGRRRASLALLAVTVAVVAWAWWWRADIRLGGGLPFIVLNVVRRSLCMRMGRRKFDEARR